ncbi:hypothetical protein PLICBS_008001 [Purpureocillium lilacinum]|uniref:uncharacterized protein n=1 Tax=Purpureocillium lilacinum TaxID=33203 RepID=UPI0020898A53|nr:hypothetical protein PLICBS_008001 [Purpureocillium lilacinum]
MHVAHSFIVIATMVLGALSQGSPDSLQPRDPDAPSGPDVKWTVPPEDVEILQWTEPAFKAEKKAKSGGLIEDVLDKMLNVKPDWRYAYKLDRKRQPKKISSTVRCGGWRSGDMHRIEHLISVLRRPSAPPRYSLNAGKCARIACEENASITWCNDTSESESVEDWRIADSAQHLVNMCRGPVRGVSGRNIEVDGWSTYIGGESCNWLSDTRPREL